MAYFMTTYKNSYSKKLVIGSLFIFFSLQFVAIGWMALHLDNRLTRIEEMVNHIQVPGEEINYQKITSALSNSSEFKTTLSDIFARSLKAIKPIDNSKFSCQTISASPTSREINTNMNMNSSERSKLLIMQTTVDSIETAIDSGYWDNQHTTQFRSGFVQLSSEQQGEILRKLSVAINQQKLDVDFSELFGGFDNWNFSH